MTDRILEFLRNRREAGQDSAPCLVVDLDVVRDNYASFAKALPDTRVFYAVKANPAPEVLSLLARLGSCFDCASVVEIEQALAAGATPDRVSFGNTIKKERDILRAFELGVRLYAVDCEAEVEKVARAAPGAQGVLPHAVRRRSAPNGRCRASSAARRKWRRACSNMRIASASRPMACRSTSARSSAIRACGTRRSRSAAGVFRELAERGIALQMVNLGGGFPTQLSQARLGGARPMATRSSPALRRHFGNRIPETIIEPGRGMVGNAGMIEAEVVLISKKSDDDEVKWVYLDIGKFNGLAETMDEMIRYPIRTDYDLDPREPCVLAGPTCDSVDVLYEKEPYLAPDQSRDRRQSADRRDRRLYDDLFRRRLQWLPASAVLRDLSPRSSFPPSHAACRKRGGGLLNPRRLRPGSGFLRPEEGHA